MTSRLLLAALAFVLLTPVAAAQFPLPTAGVVASTLVATVDTPSAPLPERTAAVLPYRVEYAVEGPTVGDIYVTVSAYPPDPSLAPAWAQGWEVVVEPTEHIVPAQPGPRATYVLEGTITIRHDGTPRGLVPHAFPLYVVAPGDGVTYGPTYLEQPFEVTPDWRPGLYAVLAAPRLLLDERGGSDVVNAEIRNTGNADALVTTSALRAPAGCAARLQDAPERLAPNERALLSIALDCERRWSAGSVTLRLEHALASDPAREGKPVEPQWDIVPTDPDDIGSASFAFGTGVGGARTYGDEPRNEASWGATLLVPIALAIAALATRRRYR